ncbi:MAG: YicC family protein [Phycisphaeraceae bacterium]|nr:YicC family protein [Phycisphaeraceae bacterium]
MLRSMTGFGEAAIKVDGVHFFLEVRSLNNKWFKATIRLPEEFQGLEADLESELRRFVTRGSVTVRATCADTSESAAYDINTNALQHYVEQLRGLGAIQSGALPLDVAGLLGLPGVLQPPANEEDRLTRARKAFRGLVATACEHLVAMREREGLMLREDLEGQRAIIVERLGQIAERAPEVSHEYETRLRTRLDRLLRELGVSVEPVELIREIAVYAEKTDIAEELARLSGHMDQFEELIHADDDRPVGRTLDFLAQEMLREANTIASKSPDSEISRLTVEIKGAIDRIKEQVQNAE